MKNELEESRPQTKSICLLGTSLTRVYNCVTQSKDTCVKRTEVIETCKTRGRVRQAKTFGSSRQSGEDTFQNSINNFLSIEYHSFVSLKVNPLPLPSVRCLFPTHVLVPLLFLVSSPNKYNLLSPLSFEVHEDVLFINTRTAVKQTSDSRVVHDLWCLSSMTLNRVDSFFDIDKGP